MHGRLLLLALPHVLMCTAGVQPARGDIFTWVDASGMVNVSNIAPPQDVRVSKVVRADPAAKASVEAAREAARAAQVQALNERVSQLEREVQLAASRPPPEIVYPTFTAPPAHYAVNAVPAYMPRVVDEPLSAGGFACNPGWTTCWPSWTPPLTYPVGVVVLNGSKGHHFHSARGGHRFGGRGHGHAHGRGR